VELSKPNKIAGIARVWVFIFGFLMQWVIRSEQLAFQRRG
jgi:hypothetical protein